ncbi:MAG TPA: GMC family oxidoreductase [Candidatus Limnocylindrales bacterium]|nr:GMC family oxidoreductase [Candidatus Limnocylindrales bacterium]
MKDAYDVVVVGGGTAGCVIAARLSEDPARSVLLVEAGPDPRPIPDVVADPKRQTELVLQSPYVRMYDVERPDGSTFPLLSGRIMGGGSSVNNLAAVRPMRADFEAWAGFGGAAWGYDALLPLMREIEADPDFAGSPIHGDAGPLHLERPFRFDAPQDPPVRALIEAAEDMGIPRCDDMNAPDPYGICSSPYNSLDGRRISTVVGWLDPARARPNLTILPETTVTRVCVGDGRATGVDLVTPDGRRSVAAGEVVITAGVYHSPQLLELSGIGREAELRRLGLPVVQPLVGVGENYHDHAVVYLTYEGTQDLREDYVIPKVRLLARSDPARPLPDLHVFMRPSIRMEGVAPLLPVSLHLLEHRSAGRVTLESTDPEELPVVDAALLRHPDDIRAMLDGVALVERLTSHPPLSRFYGPRVTPGPDDDVEEHLATTYITYHHGVGTCRIGPADDPGAVVGPDLRVHGVERLTVADASVLPTAPHGNTNLAAILVGELAARRLAAA